MIRSARGTDSILGVRLAVLLAAALAVAACGEAPRPATQPRVALELDAPRDGGSVRAKRVTVSGTVAPAGASVRVAGEDVTVTAGRFSAEVELRPGGNVIDVTATAAGRRPATGALRVARDMRVAVPDVVGQTPDAATQDLRAIGLEAEEERSDDWLDRLLGGTRVCATRPSAGALLEKGARVTLETARDC